MATWRPPSPPCEPPPAPDATRTDPLLPRRLPSLAIPILLLGLLGLLSACGQDAPRLPFLATPTPTPEQPREVGVIVVTAGSREALAGATVSGERATVFTGEGGTTTLTAMRG